MAFGHHHSKILAYFILALTVSIQQCSQHRYLEIGHCYGRHNIVYCSGVHEWQWVQSMNNVTCNVMWYSMKECAQPL